MSNSIAILFLSVFISIVWFFKYGDLPAWIILSVGVLLGITELLVLLINKSKSAEKCVKFICAVTFLYSTCITFVIKQELMAKLSELTKISPLAEIDLLKLPSVSWALFFFSICSIALSLSKSDEWSQLLKDEKWSIIIKEIIKKIFLKNLFSKFVLVIIIVGLVASIFADKMEYDFRMFFLCIPFIVISTVFGSCLKNSSNRFLVTFVLLIVAASNWIFVSYESYYSGVARRLDKEAQVSYDSTVSILKSSLPEERKYKEISNVHRFSDAEILITKEFEGATNVFYVKHSKPKKAEEYLLTIFPRNSKEFSPIFADRKVYKYKFSYYNQPILDIGLARAITFSNFPNYVKLLSKGKFEIGDNHFLRDNNYQRSTNFWVAFWVLYMFAILVFYYKQTRDEVLAENNKAIKKLQEFDLMYHKMFDDFDKASVVDTKQQLNRMSLTWSTIVEGVLGDSRHGLRNKLNKTNLTELEQDLYNKLFKDFQETILTNLRELPKVLDYHLSEIIIEEIVNVSRNEIPENYYEPEKCGLVFSEHDNINNVDKEKKCNVNKHRVASIVYNLLANAGQAVERKSMEEMPPGKTYQGKIDLIFSLRAINSNEFLSICVKDNAGGFQKEILDKVYREPVYSSNENDGGKRLGQGTMYVRYFSRLMNAKILVSNEKFNGEDYGAVVEVLIPVIVQGKKEGEK